MKSALRPRVRHAFTLVEIILAILIISGIMTVLLYFYQRSVQARQTVLQEAEFLSVSRMLMEQITGELRTARVVEDQFIGLEGTSNSISFVCTSLPQTARWIINTNEAVSPPPASDLKRVRYSLLAGTNNLQVLGVDRTEELLTSNAFTAGTNATEFVSSSGTNLVSEIDTNLLAIDPQPIRPPLSDRIKRLQFRYWAGTNWVDSWSALELPAGVEITLGKDPAPIESAASSITDSEPLSSSSSTTAEPASDQEVLEIFRRVVFLPNSVPPANQIAPEAPLDLF